MPYRALYRQWRPKDFSHVVGQKAIIETLRNQVVHDRIAHAYLFCGSRGTGKTSTAKILAKAINCEHPVNGDPCGECANCQRMDHEESLDIIEIDAASNNGVDEMRDLRDTVKYPPQFGRYKVYIVDEVHMLSSSAFNALLKTLEEPPAHVVFILATTEPQKLPETILSRCQRFDFGRLSTSEITGRLREASDQSGAAVSDGALMLIARAAEGGMRDALSILDMCLGYGDHIDESMVRNILGTSDQSFLFTFGKALIEENPSVVFRMIDEMIRDGRDPSVFAREVSGHFRCLLLAKSCPGDITAMLDITEDDACEYRNQASDCTVTRLMKILDLFMALETEMRFSASPRLALENASLKCCIRTSEADMQALSDRITELEQKINRLTSQIQAGVSTVPAAPADKPRAVSPSDDPPAAPAPSASGNRRAAAVSDSGLLSVWNQLMDTYKKNDPGIWSMLNHGRIAEVKDNIFRWQPNSEKDSFFRTALSGEERKKKIGSMLSELAGQTCYFDTAELNSVPASAGDPDQSYIDSLYQTFGREPVDIVD